MKQVQLSELEEEIEFAKKAAAAFAKDPSLATFRIKDLGPGCLMALRWGMGEDCVVVIKLHDDHIPTNYANLVKACVQ